MILAGDLLSMTIDHAQYGNKTLHPKSGEDITYKIGGLEISDDDGNYTSTGQFIYVKNFKPWKFSNTFALDTEIVGFLQDCINASVEANITFQLMNGDTYIAKGLPVGAIEPNAQAGTLALTFMGSGTVEKI